MDCPGVDELEFYLCASLDARTTEWIAGHLSDCNGCRTTLAELKENQRFEPLVRGALRNQPDVGLEFGSGEVLDGYQIVREVGRGGTSLVFEAVQANPPRRVAVKVLDALLARDHRYQRMLGREVEALARLKHPWIASVYAVGRTATGRPYFVMELVHGRPITEYAAQHNLSLRQRLSLFCHVCDGVASAHQRGVIHRDLKPSNILVEEDGSPKVLDFGLARIVQPQDGAEEPRRDPRSSESTRTGNPETAFTELGRVAGTLPYMSPEQVRGDGRDIDMRTDVYALGVILYELLTGRFPYPVERTRPLDAAKNICERPSVPPSRWAPALRGDLETIMLKALEKDPQRRYAGVAALREDIDRFLNRQPILARPATLHYQLRMLVTRHKLPVSLAASVVALILAFGVTATTMAIRIARERAAVVAAKESESRSRALAEQNATLAKQDAARFASVSDFLEEMLTAADPYEAAGAREATIGEVLDRSARKIDEGSLHEQPDVEAAVRTTLGNVYRSLGKYDAGEPHLRRAIEIRRRLSPDGDEPLAFSLNKLARLLQEKGEYDEAERLFREALTLRQRLLGEDHPDVAVLLNNLGVLFDERGRTKEAEVLHRRALAINRKAYGNEHSAVATNLNNIGLCLIHKNDLAGAEAVFRESLAIDRKLRGPEHPNVLTTMGNLGFVLHRLRRLDEAEPILVESLALTRRVHGDEHPSTAIALNSLGLTLGALGRTAEAESFYREALAINRSVRGNHHPIVATTLGNLAHMLIQQDRLDEAEELSREALAINLELYGLSHRRTVQTQYRLGAILIKKGKYDEAEPLLAAAVSHGRLSLPSGDRLLGLLLHARGKCLVGLQRRAEAEPVLVEAYEQLDWIGSAEARRDASSVAGDLAQIYDALGRTEQAALWQARHGHDDFARQDQPVTSSNGHHGQSP